MKDIEVHTINWNDGKEYRILIHSSINPMMIEVGTDGGYDDARVVINNRSSEGFKIERHEIKKLQEKAKKSMEEN